MLCWKTDEPADARVNFGTLPGTLDNAETRSTLQLVQSVTLTGLLPDTVYYYNARSADGSGNAAQSALASFRTDALPDTTPPVFVMAPQVVYASGDIGTGTPPDCIADLYTGVGWIGYGGTAGEAFRNRRDLQPDPAALSARFPTSEPSGCCARTTKLALWSTAGAQGSWTMITVPGGRTSRQTSPPRMLNSVA